MATSGQLHLPTGLPEGKSPPYLLNRRACGTQGRSRSFGERNNRFPTSQIKTNILQSSVRRTLSQHRLTSCDSHLFVSWDSNTEKTGFFCINSTQKQLEPIGTIAVPISMWLQYKLLHFEHGTTVQTDPGIQRALKAHSWIIAMRLFTHALRLFYIVNALISSLIYTSRYVCPLPSVHTWSGGIDQRSIRTQQKRLSCGTINSQAVLTNYVLLWET